MADEEFKCRAINDYFASVTDELDLKEGAVYVIMQTSPSGWWYAVNDDGEDGWVPSNYLERLNDDDDDYKDSQPPVGQTAFGGDDNASEPSLPPTEVNEPPPAPPTNNTTSYNKQPAQQQQTQQPPKQTTTTTTTTTTTSHQPNPTSAVPQQYQAIEDNAPEKPITEWSVDETLNYLENGLSARNDFKLTQACRFLTQLASKPDTGTEIIQKRGMDIVFKVMAGTTGDVAIQMSCCAAIVVLGANDASKQYPCSTNGVELISSAIQANMNYRPFTILAFNAVCNFVHNHPQHRAMALDTDVVDQIVNGIENFRGKPEGFRVHSAGCLALRNVAADPKGQSRIGPRGVEVIVKGLEEYRSTREVVEGSMGVLCNLCALPANGEAFVMGGGLQILDNIFSDPTTEDNIRLAAASVLHNLAASSDTALLLSADEGIDLVIKILKKSPVDSLLFLNTLKVLAALLFKLPEDKRPAGNKKPEVMKKLLERGVVASLNEAVGYDNKELQEVSATVLVVIAQTNPQLAQALAECDAPVRLIQPCMNGPSGQMLHCSLAVFFHVTDAFENQKRLVDGGILDFLASDWHTNPQLSDDTVRIGCGVMIKLFSNVRNQPAIAQKEEGFNRFVSDTRTNRPGLNDLLNAIENTLKQLDPTSGGISVSQTITSQPAQESQPTKQSQQAPPSNTKLPKL